VDSRIEVLAGLAVHGANVQPGQIVSIGAALGQEDIARATAAAAYRRGAAYVDVLYFDPWVKRARIEHADPSTLGYVPAWMGQRMLELGKQGAARIGFSGTHEPKALEGLDPVRLGRDQLPWVTETTTVINDGTTNWCGLPAPSPAWAMLVFPGLDAAGAYERLWSELWHVLRLDEPDPEAAWSERLDELLAAAAAIDARRFDALELVGPGTELTIGLLPSSKWLAARMVTRSGIVHIPNLPTEEVFTAPDPERADGQVSSTRPLVLKDGAIVRGLRVEFEGGRVVRLDADENAEAMRAKLEIDGAERLGEIALVDRRGRIGPLGTVFYDTLLDENAASHIALGSAYSASAGPEDQARLNRSGIHIDFMIGSPELEVTGITRERDRVPVMREGNWML
jgi:aminopeptidase